MALRHTPRQPERDIRLHDPHAHHSHSLPPPPHPIQHAPPHMNGHTVPNTPLAGGPAPPPSASMAPSPAVPSGSTNPVPASIRKLAEANEQTWLLIGRVAEQMGNLEHALSAYENALRHNPTSRAGLTQVAGIARIKENYPKAIEYFQRVLSQEDQNGEVWSALGHCYLMQDDLQKAYSAYQQALYLLPNPKEDPKLWYGIGILYDRYGSLDHAEEAFASVLRMDKVELDFDKANEILFRLGIIYKQQGKFEESLQCFDRILRNPPNPLAHADIWFQIGHVYEQQEDHVRAREAYERVVADNPTHAKVLQQLGWLYHQDGTNFQNQDVAINYLTKSLEADPSDAQSWYLLGRAYMAGQKYNKAYEAYQQAVYRDGRNPTFWCSIGVLYFQINQYRDALDAYSRAIRINPYISEVWFDLGSLYESCNNQITDAIDAYARAAELDPSNAAIAQRLQLLRNAQITGNQPPPAPGPQDVHPTAYANPVMPQPAGLSGPPLLLQSGGGPRPLFRADSRGPPNELPLPHAPPQMNTHSSPGPFRGGPPPALVLDDNQRPPPHALAPMDVDRPQMMREPSGYPREGGPRNGLAPSHMLHHPAPHQQGPHPHEQPYARPIRMPSHSASPPPHPSRGHPGFSDARPPPGPAYNPHHSRSPRIYARQGHSDQHDRVWEWVEGEHEHRGRDPQRIERGPHPQQMYQSRPHSPSYPPHRAPSPRHMRDSPPEASPRNGFSQRHHWDQKPVGPGARGRSPGTRGPLSDMVEPAGRRYDPRFDGREPQHHVDFDREHFTDAASPETSYHMRQPAPPQPFGASGRGASESPRMTNQAVLIESKARGGRKVGKDIKEPEVVPPTVPSGADPQKKRRRAPRRPKDEAAPTGPQFPATPGQPVSGYEVKPGSQGSPEPASSNGSNPGSGVRSGQPSPTNSAHAPPTRPLYEDYDEGVADTLVKMSQSRTGAGPESVGSAGRSPPGGTRPPNRTSAMSPHSMSKHPSTGRPSPPVNAKRPLSPGPDEPVEAKRSRIGSVHRRNTSPGGTGSRPSPIPFRQQPTSHSPEMRQEGRPASRSYPPSPSLPTVLPPHPRPVGSMSSLSTSSVGMPPPPSSNRSPGSVTSPIAEADRMQASRSQSPVGPRMAAKRDIVLHNTGSPHHPVSKGTPSPSSSNGSHAKLVHN